MDYFDEINSSICFICGFKSLIYSKDLVQLATKCSETKVYQLLEGFLGYSLSDSAEKLSILKNSITCQDCIMKLDDYDTANQRALSIRDEMLNLMKDNKMLNLSNDENKIHADFLDSDNNRFDSLIDTTTEYLYEEIPPELYVIHSIKNEENIEKVEQEIEIKERPEIVVAPQKPILMKCKTCNETFNNLTEMKKHRHIKNENKNVAERDVMEVEIKTIKNRPVKKEKPPPVIRPLRPIPCGKCDKEFLSRSEFKVHMKAHDEIEMLVCDICGMGFKSKAALDSHALQHKGISPHTCTVCGKTFSQRGALVRHMPIHTGVKAYQCDKCGKQFIHYSSFHMHQLAHDNIREKKCSICGFQLRSNSHLTRHMRVHSGEKPFECPTCGQKFAQRYNMMTHLKAHQGIYRDYNKSYPCPLCDTNFQRKTKLQEHLSSVHNTVVEASLIKAVENAKKLTTEGNNEERTESSLQLDENISYVDVTLESLE